MWGDANPSYTESPHSPLETPQKGAGRGSARASDFCRPTYERWESRPRLRLRNPNHSHRPVPPLGLFLGTPNIGRSPGQKDSVCPLWLPGPCCFCCHHRPDRAGLSLAPSPARSGIVTAWTGGLSGNTEATVSVGLKEGPSPELGLCLATPSGVLWRHP